jgi:hypothetical protein
MLGGMQRGMQRGQIGALVAVAAMALGCSDPQPQDRPCAPETIRWCDCLGGETGRQFCGEDERYGACVCGEEPDGGADGGPLDGGVRRDAGRDAGVRDAGQDAGRDGGRDGGTDAGADAAPPLPTCVGEGIWRNTTYWCEHHPNVLRDYECDLVWESHAGGGSTWHGTVATVHHGLTFVLNYGGLSSYVDRVYACHRPGPTAPYRQSCEIPLSRACRLAERFEEHRGGVDFRPICAAAQERGLATVYAFNSPVTGCR